jgi:hypothetical protein
MELPAELLEFKAVVRRFIDEQVIPHEKDGEMSPEVLARVLAQMEDPEFGRPMCPRSSEVPD